MSSIVCFLRTDCRLKTESSLFEKKQLIRFQSLHDKSLNQLQGTADGFLRFTSSVEIFHFRLIEVLSWEESDECDNVKSKINDRCINDDVELSSVSNNYSKFVNILYPIVFIQQRDLLKESVDGQSVCNDHSLANDPPRTCRRFRYFAEDRFLR